MASATIVVIGSIDDPHVRAVLDASNRSNESLVVDAHSIREMSWSIGPSEVQIGDWTVRQGTRGWIRRLAPAGHQHGLTLGTVEAAEHSAWLALLTSLMRLDIVTWLSPFDVIIGGEDKLVQYAAAKRLGIPYPDTVVTSTSQGLRERFGPEVVIKPLGVAHFSDPDETFKVVAAQSLATDDERLVKLAGAPFIVQERLHASAHLRVVTVLDDVFGAELDARGLPLDWRTAAEAHHSFQPRVLPDEVQKGALRIATELGARYSSQDWAVTENGAYFLDLNPVGQWLFLPKPVADAVTAALAAWVDGLFP